jgi:hypothetical protein
LPKKLFPLLLLQDALLLVTDDSRQSRFSDIGIAIGIGTAGTAPWMRHFHMFATGARGCYIAAM